MANGHVAGLFVYPIKGCRGIALDRAVVEPMGFAFDRRWMIVRENGRFLSQRELPALASIVPELADGEMILRLGGVAHGVPLTGRGERVEVTIWKHRIAAFAPDPAVDRALSQALGRSVRLVRFDERVTRLSNPAVSPAGTHTGFSDEFPILVTSTASLDRLNDHLVETGAQPVPMARFRPNVVVSGLPAWAEDHHRLCRIGAEMLQLISPCERCIVTTVDQIDGSRQGQEPITTLCRVHSDRAGKPLFGWNAAIVPGPGTAPVLHLHAPVSLQEGKIP